MLLTWRATVFSLRIRSAAIARLVLPAATRRAPRTSRAVSPPAVSWQPSAATAPPPGRDRARRRAAAKTQRAASSSISRAVLVPERPAGEPDQDPRPRGFVRHLELLPGRPRPAQRAERGARVALGERGRRPWRGRPRARSSGAPRSAAIADSSSAAGARRGDVIGGEHDLDVGGEQPRPRDAVLRLVDDAADRRRRGVELPLGQPQQRQAGLRLAAPPARLAVRLLGLRELARAAGAARPAGRRPRPSRGWPAARAARTPAALPRAHPARRRAAA